MKLKSELDTLIVEYKKMKELTNKISNDTVLHSEEFCEWLANTVMDTCNYEKLLKQILDSEYEVIGEAAEIESKPILSCSEFITTDSLSSINYNSFVNNRCISELGANRTYQRTLKDLRKNIGNIKLLLMQSYESEDMRVQESKLIRTNNLSIVHDLPFIIGCYGHLDSKFFQQKEKLLTVFLNAGIDKDVDFYTESYNNVACRIIVPKKSKVLIKSYGSKKI